MTNAIAPYLIDESILHGETLWIAIRARGAEWSWLTPEEAATIGRTWVEKYGRSDIAAHEARAIGNRDGQP